MTLVFGGTTEGRKAVQVIDKAGQPFYYSTKGDLQEVNSLHGIRLNGAMDAVAMVNCCKEHSIHLIVDAAHPFAEQLHQTISDVAEAMHIPVIRYERIYPPRSPDIIWCNNYRDAIDRLQQEDVHKLLALTGVQTIGKLKPFWLHHTECWFRILNREESLSIATKQGFPHDKLLFYQRANPDSAVIKRLCPDAILLKESGISGGFVEKVTAARDNKIKIFAIKHPPMPDGFHTVDGEHGLRRAIEQLLPGFYPLRTGVTTGSCATAASVAALTCLITGREQTDSIIILPNGESIHMLVSQIKREHQTVACSVIKDSGDDTDVTNGIAITATVRLLSIPERDRSALPSIIIIGGRGVGTVTLPGLGLDVGAPAINAAPRKMITENLRRVYAFLKGNPLVDIEVTLTVREGEEIARRTFNPRLGVIGGISIIGTSGIIQPFSVEAFVSSIRKSMEVAKAGESPRIVINSGAKSERYLRDYYPELPETAFVQYGNYVGETLKIAAELDIKQVSLGAMIGKAVKLAEGHLDTHSKEATMNTFFLKEVAKDSGCSKATQAEIEGITLARELWAVLPEEESMMFFTRLVSLCRTHCDPLLPHGELTLFLIKEDGEIFNPQL